MSALDTTIRLSTPSSRSIRIWVDDDGTVHVQGAKEVRTHYPVQICGKASRYLLHELKLEEAVTVRSYGSDDRVVVELISNKLLAPGDPPTLIAWLPYMDHDPSLVVNASCGYDSTERFVELRKVSLVQETAA